MLIFNVYPIISPAFATLSRDNIVVSAIEINACGTCHSVDKLVCFWNLQVEVEICR